METQNEYNTGKQLKCNVKHIKWIWYEHIIKYLKQISNL